MKAKTLSSCILLLAVAACQLIESTARASVTFSVTPAAVSNFYAGPITLQVGGLNPGETVQIDKFMDANGNGVIDAADLPVQSFPLTDGQASVIGGVININVPGDSTPTNGAITAQLSIAHDITQQIVAQHLFRLSSSTSRFTPLTNLFNVTNSAFAQSFTGTVRNGGSNVPNVVVMVAPANSEKGGPLAGVMADNAGSYTLNLPGGTYSFWLFKSNFVANMSQSPMLTLTNGATFSTNLHFLMPATTSISGKLVDAANPNTGVPGIFMVCQTLDRQLMAGACYTGTNGAFTVPVTAGQWEVSMASEGLAAYGYLGSKDGPQANTTTGSVSGVTFLVPKATALFYGTVLDSLSHPFVGLDIYCWDNNQQYEADGFTDANGYFVAPVVGGLNNDSWQVQVSGDVAPPNYLFSQPSFNQNGGTNISAGQAVLVNFTAVLATNHISGWLKDNNGNPIVDVGIWANATINGVDYRPGSVRTDTNGNYSLNVANGTWTVGVNTCHNCDDGLPGYYFSPTNQPVVIADNNGTANFTALSATYQITGHVQQADNNPIGGVGVGASATINGVDYMLYVDTDGNGDYSFNVANGSWTVGLNPSSGSDSLDAILGSGTYQPLDSQNVNINNNNGTANFTVILNAGFTNSISGWLKDNNGNPIGGVGMFATATINGVDYYEGNAATDPSGNYSLNVGNGTWTVGVNSGAGGNLPGNYVCPGQSVVVISNNNGTANFTALLATQNISGHVQQNNGSPIGTLGVWAIATINSASFSKYGTTDASGNYSLNVVNGSWTVMLQAHDVLDSLDSIFGSGNYQDPGSQNVPISNNNGTANFTVQTSGMVPLQITTSNLPSGTVGVTYNHLLGATGGQPSYTWWLPGGTASLPPGQFEDMNLSSGGTIYGVPSAPGTYTFWVGVYDSASPANTVTQQVSLTINEARPDVSSYYLVKLAAFLQVGPASFVPNTNFGPFNACVGLVQSIPGVVPIANVTLPNGSARALPWGSSGLELQYWESFPNQASIDAAYPPGNYTFGLYALNNGLWFPVLSNPPAAYPNPPHVNNLPAAQAINPLSPFTLQWDSIPGATTNDSLWVFVTEAGGPPVFSTPQPSIDRLHALPGTATSVVIPTNTFQPGHAYMGSITYFRTTSVNLTEYPGAAGVTVMAAATTFPLALASASLPVLSEPTRISSTQFGFLLSGAPGQNYTVLIATNAAQPLSNWSTLLVTNPPASPVFIQDNQATNKQRFYRVKVGL